MIKNNDNKANIIDFSKVQNALDKIETGLYKYKRIMKNLHEVDVSKDAEFKKYYNGFYRMRQRKQEFYNEYYEFMENNKNNDEITFEYILNHFYNKFERVESSFCSKLLATINPDMPIWDEFVLQNLNLKKPSTYSNNRIEKTIDIYLNIQNWYENYLNTEESKMVLELFDKQYPNEKITNVKKIDLILWQIRD